MNNNKIETLRIVSEEDLRNLTRPGGNGKENRKNMGSHCRIVGSGMVAEDLSFFHMFHEHFSFILRDYCFSFYFRRFSVIFTAGSILLAVHGF